MTLTAISLTVNPLTAETVATKWFQPKPPQKASKPPLSLYPEVAAYSSEEAIARLEVSKPTFNDYRRFALKHIPDYEEVCDRIWIEKYGQSVHTIRLAFILKNQRPPSIDQPPYYEPQLQILEGVQRLIKRTGSRRLAVQRLQNHPNSWRK